MGNMNLIVMPEGVCQKRSGVREGVVSKEGMSEGEGVSQEGVLEGGLVDRQTKMGDHVCVPTR